MTFKEQNRIIQEYVKQLKVLRDHNLKFKEGDFQDTFLPIPEMSQIICTLEAFLRVLPDLEPMKLQTLHPILEYAISKKVLKISPADFKYIMEIRNSFMHGNFAQLASRHQMAVAEYCKTQFLKDVETMYNLVDGLVDQIDPETGKPKV